ncbi:hypothetical protein ABMY26_09590 [Azospirillum sp. HJ39]|uniref:hypothetical protein n=1 Tax=Azospirillum sp. HJ39 TaxID=3159496 RepID=UPI0035591839
MEADRAAEAFLIGNGRVGPFTDFNRPVEIIEDARKQGTRRSDLDPGPQNLLQRPEQLLL